MKQTSPVFNFFAEKPMSNSSFLNFGFLAGQISQIIQLGSTHFTMLVDRNTFDKRRIHRKNSFYTYISRHFTNSKMLLSSMTRNFHNITLKLLDSFLVSFLNSISYCDGITTSKLRISFYFLLKRLFCNF